MLAAIHVGNIDSAIGANESMPRFGDHDPMLLTQQTLALAQGELGNARVQFVTPRPCSRLCRRANRIQLDKLAFCFRNDLVLHDQNVALRQRKPSELQSLEQFLGKRVTRLYLTFERDRNDPQLCSSHDLFVCSQREIAEIPLASEALGAGFAGQFDELAEIGRIVDVDCNTGKRQHGAGLSSSFRGRQMWLEAIVAESQWE